MANTPSRNVRNFNRETENAVDRNLNKEYNPGRPISLREQIEAAKAAKKIVKKEVNKEVEMQNWLNEANTKQRIVSRKMNASHGRF